MKKICNKTSTASGPIQELLFTKIQELYYLTFIIILYKNSNKIVKIVILIIHIKMICVLMVGNRTALFQKIVLKDFGSKWRKILFILYFIF